MTTGRITTGLGALALGVAMVAAPALAQTSTGATNQPSATTSTPPATSAAPSGSTSSMPKTTTTTSKTGHVSKQAATESHTHHMAMRETHHGMHGHTAMHVSEANPNAQDPAVARLNEQSLQAAQQGKPFTPSSGM